MQSVALLLPSSYTAEGEAMAGNGQGPKVLIVDDDEEVRHVLRILCEMESYEVIGEAANGLEAISIAMTTYPDFVILDYLMPHLDGAGTATMLRAIVPDARIVAFSAVLDTKPEWCDSYLNKERLSEIAPLLDRLIRVA
jgi:CheY-like chemotaxis protein